jgi:predicted ester cyclase
MTIDEPIASGDRVAARWTVRATHQDEVMGIPATGQEVEVTGIAMLRFSGGTIVEQRENWDGLGLMRQLGVLPLRSQAGR